MSDVIKHECGIALIRLLKPLRYYHEKYGTALYGLNKLYLLMEKQHNRGQDGAGVVTIKLDMQPGQRYISRKRSNSKQPIADIFEAIYRNFKELESDGGSAREKLNDPEWLKANVPYTGELLLGHLRYGTHGKNTIETVHPFLRQNNWKSRNLALAGNFNLTNVEELFNQLVELGQHPKEKSDTVTVLEKIGHFLDVENQRLFDKYKRLGYNNKQISALIEKHIDIQYILKKSSDDFDGGYTIAGLIGHGDAFVLRDPNGIRPAFYYYDDEVAVVASERPAIQTTFNVKFQDVKEIDPGHALIIKRDGRIFQVKCQEPGKKSACSFERIYFSRGSDREIYTERKRLGYLLKDQVLRAINYDLENTVFSFIPNTAEVAFYGLLSGIEEYLNQWKKEQIQKLSQQGKLDEEALQRILSKTLRIEKLAIKDAKLRTFITEDVARDELVSHVYDVTYGIIRDGQDTMVMLDDSIVRGTTLKQSILSNLGRLRPKKIIIVSSAPQIRYPDCYGIDMSKMQDFVAFRAAIALLEERGMKRKIEEIYHRCKRQLEQPGGCLVNEVKALYAGFTPEEISAKIAQIVKPEHLDCEVEIIYQTIENLHKACPGHTGDWYFSGDYPTRGGIKVVNRAFVNFIENKNVRPY